MRLCVQCGLPCGTGDECGQCASTRRRRRLRERRTSEGLCPVCAAPAADGTLHCEDCLRRNRESRRAGSGDPAWPVEAKCSRCGNGFLKTGPRHTLCAECPEGARSAEQRKRIARRRSEGRCTYCGEPKPVDRYTRCESCREKTARVRDAWTRARKVAARNGASNGTRTTPTASRYAHLKKSKYLELGQALFPGEPDGHTDVP